MGERGFGVPTKFFLQFLYLWKVLIKNPDDAKLAPLGKLSNMQIRMAITKISFLGHNSIIIQDERKIMISASEDDNDDCAEADGDIDLIME